MRLLIVDSNPKERDATLRLLPSDGHEIKIAKDAAEALVCLETREFDVLLVEVILTGTSGTELIKRIRARESDTHVYIVATAARAFPGDLKTAFLCGADDFIRKPIARDELLVRIEGGTRVRRWASRILAGGAATDFAARSSITSLTAWTSADSAVCSELGDMLGFPLIAAACPEGLEGAVEVATLPLSLAAEQAEISLAIGADQASTAALAELMFGSPTNDASAIKDMMRELANVAGGAFKRMAATEGGVLTTGLPGESTPETFRHPKATARKQWIGTVEGSAIALRFELELRVREWKRVRVASLREGMVVALDLRNPLGALLVPSGTRITESHLGGLRRSLGDDGTIDIVEAA